VHVERTAQMIEALLLATFGTALGGLLGRESSALLCQLSRALLDRGLRRFPRRRRKEIEADFEAYSERPLAGLLFAMRTRWTAPRGSCRSVLASITRTFEDLIDSVIEEKKGNKPRILLWGGSTSSPGLVGARVVLEMERRRHATSHGLDRVSGEPSADGRRDADSRPRSQPPR
jgi:hypothetical protein